eukprot:403332307
MITKENQSELDNSNFEVVKIFAIRFSFYYTQVDVQCAGDFLDITAQKISVAFFTYDHVRISASITTLDFNQPTQKQYTFKNFYSSQNGFEIYFYSSFFKNLDSSILAGYIRSQYFTATYMFSNQAVLIDLPEPYYFSMGNPDTKWVIALGTSLYQFVQNTTVNWQYIVPQSWEEQVYYPSTNFELYPVFTYPNNQQIIDIATNRTLALPSGINSTYKYTIGMPASIIEFGICKYDQNCTDEIIGYSILFQNGSAIPSTLMTFSATSRKLIVSSTNKQFEGQYNLMFRCSLIDEFKNSQNFTLVVNSQHNSVQYYLNYAPEFLEKLQERWTIRAGSEATFTLPKYYDPNPEDFVSVKLETIEKYRQFFKVQNQKYIAFNAGFPELGDIEMIVTLSDNHKPQPKSTKYRMTITFMPSPYGQMKNDYVNQVNVSTQDKPLIYSFNSNKGIKIQSISPDDKSISDNIWSDASSNI